MPQWGPHPYQQHPPDQPGYEQLPFGYGASTPPAYGYPPRQGKPSDATTMALGLSISGLLMIVVGAGWCAPLALVSLGLGVVGCCMGTQQIRLIDAGTADATQRSTARAAQIIGAIAVGMVVLMVVVVIAALGFRANSV